MHQWEKKIGNGLTIVKGGKNAMTEPLFKIGDRVVSDEVGNKEGTIIASAIRDEKWAERYKYKIRWDKGIFRGTEWVMEYNINKIHT